MQFFPYFPRPLSTFPSVRANVSAFVDYEIFPPPATFFRITILIFQHDIFPCLCLGLNRVEYPGITEAGVELARERAMELKELIETAEPGSVIFLGGSSDSVRTKSTAEVYGDELKKVLAENPSVRVFDKSDIERIKEEGGKFVSHVLKQIEENKDKKIVVISPLVLKELSLNEWVTAQGLYIPYFAELMKRNNNNRFEAAKEWYRTDGKLGELTGPTPKEVAERYLKAISRLRKFAENQISGRPLVVGMVGHSFEIDALITYLANNGDPTPEKFDQISEGTFINETELTKIETSKDGTTVEYRGKKYPIKNEVE